MGTTHLSKTLGTPTGTKKLTISFWVKRTKLGASQILLNQNADYFYFHSNDYLDFEMTIGRLATNRLFRDTSSFYHIVIAVDTTLATADDRIKMYINGVQETSFQARTNPSQDATFADFNTAAEHTIGKRQSANDMYFDGLLTHYHFIDGTAYAATDFGETDSTSGIWKPKTAPSVTYGNNGFFLKFENAGSLGTDSSGNGNNFTVNGTPTQTIDTPTNNFITINPLDNYYPACTFSNGNTTVATGNNYSYCQSTIYVNKGKWYWEVKAISKSSGADEFMIGIQGKSATGTNSPAQNNNGITYYKDGDTYGFGGGATSYGNSYTVGDIIGVALDCDNNKLYFSKNGTYQNSGVPTSGSTGTGALAITDPNDVPQGGYSPVGGAYTSVSHTLSFNFGNGYFGTTAVASANADANGHGAMEYAVPSGYYTLNTENLKEFG